MHGLGEIHPAGRDSNAVDSMEPACENTAEDLVNAVNLIDLDASYIACKLVDVIPDPHSLCGKKETVP